MQVDKTEDAFQFVGIRAHDIEEMREDSKEAIELKVLHVALLPFEVQYLLGNETGKKYLIWKVGRQQDERCLEIGTSVKICLPKQKILKLD